MVVHRQRIAELHAKGQPLLLSHALQGTDQLDCARILQVVFERTIRHLDLVIAQLVVQDLAYLRLAQEGRVQLHGCVQPPLPKQVGSDALDLVRRAAVHGGQRHIVRDARRHVDIHELRELLLQDRLQPAEL